jgi:hypothetical protein
MIVKGYAERKQQPDTPFLLSHFAPTIQTCVSSNCATCSLMPQTATSMLLPAKKLLAAADSALHPLTQIVNKLRQALRQPHLA